MAEIIRAQPGGDGHMVAVRFDAVDPAMRQPLNELIEVLLHGDGRRPARGTARGAPHGHPLSASSASCARILEDISRGGLAMTVADPLVLYEELEVTVPDTGGDAAPHPARARRPSARRRARRRRRSIASAWSSRNAAHRDAQVPGRAS